LFSSAYRRANNAAYFLPLLYRSQFSADVMRAPHVT
jgi:hypothetical protein